LRLQKIEPLFDKFESIQSQIELLVEGEMADQDRERTDFEAIYFKLTSRARTRLGNTVGAQGNGHNQPETHMQGNESQLGVKLPVIKLPNFDGFASKWIKFRDTFQSLIHSNQLLTDIQKFHYLDSVLTGDAARVIEALGISSANYKIAWRTLKERFEDVRTLSYYHVKSLFELPSMLKDSHSSLQQLIDKQNTYLLSLETLGKPVKGWDTMIIYLLSTVIISLKDGCGLKENYDPT